MSRISNTSSKPLESDELARLWGFSGGALNLEVQELGP